MRRLLIAALLIAGCTKSAPPAAAPAAPGETQTSAPAAAGDAGAPVDAISVEPTEPLTGQSLVARVADPLDRTIEFTWLIDGAEVPGEHTDRLEGKYVKKGVAIAVRAVPHSDAGEGQAKTSDAISVVNSPPRIDSIDLVSSADNTVVMQTKAQDPDGDELKYRLVSAPPGMTIDGEGRVQWSAPADFAAAVSFVVGATDGSDEATMQGDIGSK